MNLHLGSAWELFDGVERVTYFPFDVVTDAPKTFGVKCDGLRRAVDKQERPAADSGEVTGQAARWHLRAEHLCGVTVGKRGVIQQANGTRWLIESVRLVTLGTRWECETWRLPTTS